MKRPRHSYIDPRNSPTTSSDRSGKMVPRSFTKASFGYPRSCTSVESLKKLQSFDDSVTTDLPRGSNVASAAKDEHPLAACTIVPHRPRSPMTDLSLSFISGIALSLMVFAFATAATGQMQS